VSRRRRALGIRPVSGFWKWRRSRDFVAPRKIRLEAMSSCQLRCPACPTTTGEIRPVIGAGYLKLGDFERLVRENPRVRQIELSNFGEILLNPDFVAILAHAHERGIALAADNGLNLNTASDEQLEAIVRFGLRSATISLDGASQETYSAYRIRGDLSRVLANIEKINELKRRHRSRFPRLAWQFIVFGHNEHELPRAREMARAFDMEFRPKLSYEDTFSPIRDEGFVRSQLPVKVASRGEYERRFGVHHIRSICHQLWTEPQVNWDGKILGCCVNYWGDFGGNAFEDGLDAALNSERLRVAREMLLGRSEPRAGIPCTTCSVYKSLKERGNWLTRREIEGRDRRIHSVRRLVYRHTGARKLVSRLVPKPGSQP